MVYDEKECPHNVDYPLRPCGSHDPSTLCPVGELRSWKMAYDGLLAQFTGARKDYDALTEENKRLRAVLQLYADKGYESAKAALGE